MPAPWFRVLRVVMRGPPRRSLRRRRNGGPRRPMPPSQDAAWHRGPVALAGVAVAGRLTGADRLPLLPLAQQGPGAMLRPAKVAWVAGGLRFSSCVGFGAAVLA